MSTIETITYDKSNLPPFIDGTSGHLRPKPDGTVAACQAPVAVDDLPYPKNWGADEGATMEVPQDGWVTCLGPGDSYHNDEFEYTSKLGRVLDPEEDPRAAELRDFWQRHGHSVAIFEAQKTVGAIVLGEVAPEAVGAILVTKEGPETLSEGDLVVMSPRRSDRVYRITPENRKKQYADDGRVFPGELPATNC